MPAPLATLVASRAIVMLHDECTVRWHEAAVPAAGSGADLETLSGRQHLANFLLWHAEDEARLPAAADAAVAAIKRRIDQTNQQRNDATEMLDSLLLRHLAAVPRSVDVEQHSETPGMMIDRLSILSLRLFHTRQEIERADAPAGHRERNQQRLVILEEQRGDLTQCLDRLWAQVCAGTRCFKQYRQLKMYNDPELNPVLYGAPSRSKARSGER